MEIRCGRGGKLFDDRLPVARLQFMCQHAFFELFCFGY